jgi:hypothetical protein
MSVREYNQLIKRPVMDDSVRVQDKNVFALARTDTDVIALCESQVSPVLN